MHQCGTRALLFLRLLLLALALVFGDMLLRLVLLRDGRGLHQQLEGRVVSHEVLKSVDGLDPAVFHPDDSVAAVEDPQLMCGQYSGLVFQQPHDRVVEDVATDVGIDGGERIIHEDQLGVEVDGAGHVETLLLTPGNRDTTLPNLRLVALREDFQIGLQRASVDDLVVPGMLLAVA